MSKLSYTHAPTLSHSSSRTVIVTDGLCSHHSRAYTFHSSSCSIAVMSLRVTAPAGDLTGKLNTVVLSGFITHGSDGMPESVKNCVRGSLLSPRTVRI